MAQRRAPSRNFMESVLTLTPLSTYVQEHMIGVYGTLATGVGASACGAAFQMATGAPATGFLAIFATIASMFYFLSQPPMSSRRGPALHLFAFTQGFATGPLLQLVADIDMMLPCIALAATASIFACLSGAALFSKRREYIYLGGVLGTAVTALFWVGLLNAFIRSSWMFGIQLYAGLLVFCGYVLYDSQLIIEKAEHGDKDKVQHAFDLFVDLLAIFRRVLIIMAQNSESRRKRNRDRDEE